MWAHINTHICAAGTLLRHCKGKGSVPDWEAGAAQEKDVKYFSVCERRWGRERDEMEKTSVVCDWEHCVSVGFPYCWLTPVCEDWDTGVCYKPKHTPMHTQVHAYRSSSWCVSAGLLEVFVNIFSVELHIYVSLVILHRRDLNFTFVRLQR